MYNYLSHHSTNCINNQLLNLLTPDSVDKLITIVKEELALEKNPSSSASENRVFELEHLSKHITLQSIPFFTSSGQSSCNVFSIPPRHGQKWWIK